jgi:hypothetical protein
MCLPLLLTKDGYPELVLPYLDLLQKISETAVLLLIRRGGYYEKGIIHSIKYVFASWAGSLQRGSGF